MASCVDIVVNSLYPKLVSATRKGIDISGEKIESLVERSVEEILEFEEYDLPLDEIKKLAKGKLEQQLDIDIGIPSVTLDRSKPELWLSKAKGSGEITWKHWELYEDYLLTKQKPFPEKTVTSIDQATDNILDRIGNPKLAGPWSRRGLVIGSVQMGKTGNFIGLISKAADVGYKFIVVLAGLHNILREQTQQRIEEGFIGLETCGNNAQMSVGKVGVGLKRPEGEPRPIYLTTRDLDFNKIVSGIGLQLGEQPVVVVVKKNAHVLKHLLKWLRGQHHLGDEGSGKTINHPMLLIDDEADNASINTSSNQNKVTKINERIRQILELFSRRSYVGFTATPFANIFINPDTYDNKIEEDDLFPRDFIMTLPQPSNYVGPSEYFPDSDDQSLLVEINDSHEMIGLIHKSDDEVVQLSPSLEEAIELFILARAIRLVRGQLNEHHSMLVNVSFYTLVQNQIAILIKSHLRTVQKSINSFASFPIDIAIKDPVINRLKSIFDGHYLNSLDDEIHFSDILHMLKKSISEVEVIAVNQSSSDSATYDDFPDGRTVIAVGGISLSRGFTLEGLLVSYFARNTKMYDTLMQMGRWFGYRDGYRDVCRLFMPTDSIEWYSFIARSIVELNAQIREMKRLNRTPLEFGLRVRQHPSGLLVTARNKLGSATDEVRYLSFWNWLQEITRLHSDTTVNEQNIDFVKAFIHRLQGDSGITKGFLAGRGHLHSWKGVPNSFVSSFLSSFSFPECDPSQEALCDFVSELNEHKIEGFGQWEVVLFSLKSVNNLAPWRENYPWLDSIDFGNGIRAIPKGRKANVDEDGACFSFCNSRIGDTGFERLFLDDEGTQVKESYEAEDKDGKSKSVPDFEYRKSRKHPVLIIYPVAVATGEKDIITKDDVYLTFSVSFPPAPSAELEQLTLVKYKVNEVYRRMGQPLATEIEDEGADDEK